MTRLSTLSACTLLALSSLLLGSEVDAQVKPCVGFNDSNNNATNLISARSGAFVNRWAWRYPSPTVRLVQGMRVYTGGRYSNKFMKVEIWDEDSTTSLPGKMLASGTWQASKPSKVMWQGANFDRTVLLRSRTNYWLVWRENGWNQMPFDPSGNKMAAARWTGSGWSTIGSTALKARLYCQPIDSVGATVYGKSCSNADNRTGTTFTNENANIGNANYGIEASGLPAGAPGVFILGVLPSFPSIPIKPAPGCFLNADTTLLIPTVTGTGNVRAATAAGHTFFPIALPNDTKLRGVFFAIQCAVLDKASKNALPMVFTNAMRTKVY